MTTILGLDVATSCGIGWVNPAAPPETWRALALETIGDTPWQKIEDYDFDLRCLIAAGPKVDFAIIERPIDVIMSYGQLKESEAPLDTNGSHGRKGKTSINATTVILLSGMVGNTIGVLNSLDIPYGLIRTSTWHKAYYGSGVKPDGEWDKRNGPQPEKWSQDWKELAVRHARLQNIILPTDKKSAKDAAEAVGMAVAWKAVSEIPPRHRNAFMQLRMGNGR